MVAGRAQSSGHTATSQTWGLGRNKGNLLVVCAIAPLAALHSLLSILLSGAGAMLLKVRSSPVCAFFWPQPLLGVEASHLDPRDKLYFTNRHPRTQVDVSM